MEHDSIAQRLSSERNVWLATNRPGRSPHLIPIWFVWIDERFWICTSESVKTRNIAVDPHVSIALENGNAPAVAEGRCVAHERPYPADISAAFGEKYQWDINRLDDEDGAFDVLLKVTVTRWVFDAP